ncbi:MAG: AAA family ATPase [Bdellovibrionales bacterium]|nr:AAA family ATPase [Bdellovibrionales bacterium]
MTSPLFGQDRIQRSLDLLYQRDRLPQSLLIAGSKGCGKLTLAKALAQLLLCERAHESKRDPLTSCGTCHQCLVVSAGNHPDVFLVNGEEKDEGDTQAIRGLLSQLAHVPFSGSRRVIILKEVQKLPQQALNALLKSLEEPRPSTFFILTSSQPAKLISTIRSRCQQWDFDELKFSDFNRALSARSNPAWDILEQMQKEALYYICDGCPGQAEELLQELPLWKELTHNIQRIEKDGRVFAISYAQELATQKDRLPLLLRFLRAIARKKMKESSDTLDRTRCAVLLQNLIIADYAISDRHMNATTVLSSVFDAFATSKSQAIPFDSSFLISETLV